MNIMIYPEDSNLLHQGKTNCLKGLNAPNKDNVNLTLPHMGWLDRVASV
jgi:hypothetical protein